MKLHVVTVELEKEADAHGLLDLLNHWEEGYLDHGPYAYGEPESGFSVRHTLTTDDGRVRVDQQLGKRKGGLDD